MYDSLISGVVEWLHVVSNKDKPDKYTALVIVENIYYLMHQLEMFESPQLDHCVKELQHMHW